MDYSPIFGNLPKALLRPADDAQKQLRNRISLLSAYLGLIEAGKPPGKPLPRRRAQKQRGKRLAAIMRLRRERRDLERLFRARSRIWLFSSSLLPLTPTHEAARLQLKVLRAFENIWSWYRGLNLLTSLRPLDQEHCKAAAELREYYEFLDDYEDFESYESSESSESFEIRLTDSSESVDLLE